MKCPVCEVEAAYALAKDGCEYFQCPGCEFLFHRSDGSSPAAVSRSYDDSYWEMEQAEALRREKEDCFIRALELIYLSNIKVEHVLDFGCGLGITVGLLRKRLGVDAVGVDPSGQFEDWAYLYKMTLKELGQKYGQDYFDAIYSIEVFEHLPSPAHTISEMVYLLKPGGKILINTGTQEFLTKSDPFNTYIDPVGRGHISIYSLKTFSVLAQRFGLKAGFVGGRKYLVTLELPGASDSGYPVNENLETLDAIGQWFSTMFQEYMRLVDLEEEFEIKSIWAEQLKDEVARLQKEYDERGRWALDLDREVGELRGMVARLQGEVDELHKKEVDINSRKVLIKQLWRRMWE